MNLSFLRGYQTMNIGDRRRFGVTFTLSKNYYGHLLYGRFYYWINNRAVGNYLIETSLAHILSYLKWIVFDNNHRFGEHLCVPSGVLSKEDIFYSLNTELYPNEDTYNNFNRVQLPDSVARFNIKMNIDVFIGTYIYLIDCENKSMILYKKNGDLIVSELTLEKGEFDQVICQVFEKINYLLDKELEHISRT
jgi:hypothetical protein